MVCCNCKGKAVYGDPKGVAGTFFECGCECHKHAGKYPTKKQTGFEKRNPETNKKILNFPKWFENDKAEKLAKQEEARKGTK